MPKSPFGSALSLSSSCLQAFDVRGSVIATIRELLVDFLCRSEHGVLFTASDHSAGSCMIRGHQSLCVPRKFSARYA